MSGSLDLFETAEAEPVPHLGDGLHWPEVRGWLQTHAQTLLDDRSLLEEIGLRPHGRNVVEFGAAALTRLEAVVERETGARREVEHPVGGPIPTVANPIRLSESPVEYDRAPPQLGQHTDEVLSDLLGLSAAEIAALRGDGII